MKYNIIVFSKKNCPACDSVKQMLNVRQLIYSEVYIDTSENLTKLKNLLPDVKSVPQVFINNRHIGGLQDLIKEFNSNDYY